MFWNLKTKGIKVLLNNIQGNSSLWVYLPQTIWENNKSFNFDTIKKREVFLNGFLNIRSQGPFNMSQKP
jgi:hypothetical protein